jgi:hypothetical protein
MIGPSSSERSFGSRHLASRGWQGRVLAVRALHITLGVTPIVFLSHAGISLIVSRDSSQRLGFVLLCNSNDEKRGALSALEPPLG